MNTLTLFTHLFLELLVVFLKINEKKRKKYIYISQKVHRNLKNQEKSNNIDIEYYR